VCGLSIIKEGVVRKVGAGNESDLMRLGKSPDTVRAQLAQYRGDLQRFARSLTRDRAAAEDLVQDTMLRALRSAHQFTPGTNLRAWLTGILRNRFTDQCRHSAITREIDLDTLPLREPEAEPASSYLDLISAEDVRLAVDQLEDHLRATFILSYVDLLPYQAIAGRLKIPVSTVGVRLWRARKTLRRILMISYEARARDCWARSMQRRRPTAKSVLSSRRLRDVVGS
jgi:RNA polymerase sigma-70 factor (ECF subfamily)